MELNPINCFIDMFLNDTPTEKVPVNFEINDTIALCTNKNSTMEEVQLLLVTYVERNYIDVFIELSNENGDADVARVILGHD